MQWKTCRGIIDLSERGMVMGIVNATPDSFSDGGDHRGDNALDHAIRLMKEGAGIIDIGGESTKPGAEPVSLADELERVIPVIRALRSVSDVFISIDTSKGEVAREAIAAGADIVNDVTGCTGDAEMAKVCADSGVGVVVMHMQGSPETMQVNPSYDDVVNEVQAFFKERYIHLRSEGVEGEAICFDPGIGFGKRHEHNLKLLNSLDKVSIEGRPLLLGVSRKSLIGEALGIEDPKSRDAATTALTAQGRLAGCMLHRVHAVRENVDALRMVEEVMKYA